MKAYIDTHLATGSGAYSDVVSEQDYYHGGPFARSYRTPVHESAAKAEQDAREQAKKLHFQIVDSPDKF